MSLDPKSAGLFLLIAFSGLISTTIYRFFDQRRPAFLLMHLNGGALIGGYWGGNSYAGSFPNDGDIYLEAVYAVDAAGRFGAPIPNTRGVLLRKEQYSFIELFAVPDAEAAENGSTE